LIGQKFKNIIIGIVIASQVIVYIPTNTYHKFVEKHKHKKVINKNKLHSDLAKQKFNLLKQQFAEMRTINEYEKEQKLYQEKQRQIEATKRNDTLSRGNDSNYITVRLSYYTNSYSDCGKTDAISANGKNLNDGSNYIAAPNSIPFNTKLLIDGQIYTVADRGGAIGYKNGVMMLDVFVPGATQEQLIKMGVKYTTAKIIGESR
jgi:3D (Asp-Asp-Asp) domain-containing protein